MNRASFLSTVFFIVCCGVSMLSAQETFEVLVDSSETYTDLTKDMGHTIGFLATANRLVALDHENFRILFYQRGTTFTDNTPLAIAGTLGRTSTQPFDPATNPRLGREYSGAIHGDTLWVANYNASEILLFDLDGNYLSSYPWPYRVLTTWGDSLFAFKKDSIYLYDDATYAFSAIAAIPESLTVTSDLYGGIIKIGSNRLVVKKDTTLFVYDANGYLSGSSPDTLFTLHSSAIPDFEILTNRIVWSTSYGTAAALVDLNGGNRVDTTTGTYTYSYRFSGGRLYVVGSWGLTMYDGSYNLLTSSGRSQFYLSLKWLGVDDSTLYYYDFHDGGFGFASLNYQNGTFLYRPDNEIPYSGWYRIMRHGIGKKFLLSEWPQNVFQIHTFDIDSMTASSFYVPHVQSIDAVGDTIYALSGQYLYRYLPNGDTLSIDTLAYSPGSNLATLDTNATVSIAANGQNVFVGFADTLYVLSNNGVLERAAYFHQTSATKLFASSGYVLSNTPLQSFQIDVGATAPYPGVSAYAGGFPYGDRYWYESGTNEFSFVTATLVGVERSSGAIPQEFSLAQNYPNPFNPSTHIRFTLPTASQVRLDVFNLIGQRIATLVDGPTAAGSHDVVFDARGLPSGLYFYTIRSNGHVAMRKMLLLK